MPLDPPRFAGAYPGGPTVAYGSPPGPATGVIQHRVLSQTRGFWEHTAPVVAEFSHSYAEVRAVAATTLPRMRWRRLPLFRYAITWTRPA